MAAEKLWEEERTGQVLLVHPAGGCNHPEEEEDQHFQSQMWRPNKEALSGDIWIQSSLKTRQQEQTPMFRQLPQSESRSTLGNIRPSESLQKGTTTCNALCVVVAIPRSSQGQHSNPVPTPRASPCLRDAVQSLLSIHRGHDPGFPVGTQGCDAQVLHTKWCGVCKQPLHSLPSHRLWRTV